MRKMFINATRLPPPTPAPRAAGGEGTRWRALAYICLGRCIARHQVSYENYPRCAASSSKNKRFIPIHFHCIFISISHYSGLIFDYSSDQDIWGFVKKRSFDSCNCGPAHQRAKFSAGSDVMHSRTQARLPCACPCVYKLYLCAFKSWYRSFGQTFFVSVIFSADARLCAQVSRIFFKFSPRTHVWGYTGLFVWGCTPVLCARGL